MKGKEKPGVMIGMMDPEAGGWGVGLENERGAFLSLMQRRKIQSGLCNSIWNGKRHLCKCVSVFAENVIHIIIMPYASFSLSHTHTHTHTRSKQIAAPGPL